MQETSWTVRVLAGSNKGPSTVYARKGQFQAGDPLHFDPEYEHITALEYLLGAIGADLVGGLKVLARRRHLQIDNVEAVVSGRLHNPLTYLGVVGEEGRPALERVVATVYVASPEPQDQLRHAWGEALTRSPIVNTLRSSIALDLELQVTI